MIKVNLLPGGKKRKGRSGGLSFSMPKLGGSFSDPWLLAMVAVPVVALAASAWMWISVGQEEEEIQVALEAAVQDSIRFADVKEQTDLLLARADSVSQKVAIIQEIDEGRYVWPHVLDEVARALPEYTWLRGVSQVGGATTPELRITGQAGNNIALTVFMDQLEASEFIRGVRLVGTTQTVIDNTQQVVYDFTLDAAYESPSLFMLETVPLFGTDIPDVRERGASDNLPDQE